jgi:hypothetical protein
MFNIHTEKQLTVLLLAVVRTLTFTINGKDTGGKITGVQGEVHCAVQLFSVRDGPVSQRNICTDATARSMCTKFAVLRVWRTFFW